MKIKYIGHSGFMLQIGEIFLLFDYYVGELPVLPEGSRLYIFVSHRHEDHFNPAVFDLADQYDATCFLSYDIKLNEYGKRKYKISEEMLGRIVSLRYDQEYQTGDLVINTYQSTDAGVAYLVRCRDKTIYHAGDHNWWHWEDEGKQYNNNMAANYKRVIGQLAGAADVIDVAMVPLDSRLKESYFYGMKYFLEHINAKVVFPMHFSKDYQCIRRFVESFGYGERLMVIQEMGQVFEV